jgi:hypothetical protein
MVDMGSIAAALGGLKTAGEIAKALLQLKSDAERQAKVIELQSVILAAQSSAISAQSDQFAMLEEVRALKEEVARVKAWDKTKERYILAEVAPQTYVYVLKPESQPPEPSHWICTKCYEDRKRSIIQVKAKGSGTTWYICFECKSEFHIASPGGGRPLSAYRPSGGGSWNG